MTSASPQARPAVDVVVPFRGSAADLADLCRRLRRLELRPGDTLVVADNTPRRAGAALPAGCHGVTVLRACERRTPGFARNRGAAAGHAEWLVFFDSDTQPSVDLLERYFEVEPGERTALLAGTVVNEPVGPDAPAPSRYPYLRHTLDQDHAVGRGRWAFAISANMACRRSAFAAVGGFRDGIRAGEDPDLSYRLRGAGWGIERREQAIVVHLGRASVRGTIAQSVRWGAGDAWLERTYPGSRPARRLPGLMWWGVRFLIGGLARAAGRRDRDAAIRALFDPLWELAHELGRRLPNERPIRG